jgi:repressor LexA
MSVSNRIRDLRKKHGLTQKELANKLHVSPQVVSNWEREYTTPDAEDIAKLSKVLETKADYLLSLPKNAEPYEPESMTRIPLLGTIRAGEPIERIEHIEGYELVEPHLIRGRKAFALKVQGSSMIGDRIHEGDVVIVIVQEDVSSSDIAVVAVNGQEATLKRVKCQNEVCMLTPSNPAIEPLMLSSKDVHVIGKVIQVRRNL